jgi:hypothetical protein
MNRIYRSVWSESLGAWVAAAETTRARGRRGSVRSTVVAAATLLGLANVAWGAQAVNDGTLCMSQSGPGQTWTCHVPNSKGGFAIIKGLPDVGNGSSPDWVAVANAAAASIGTNALLLGDAAAVATGTGSIAVGNGVNASADNAIAIGTKAQATAAESLALGSSAQAQKLGDIAMGSGAIASGGNQLTGPSNNWSSVAVGTYASATEGNSVALGGSAKAEGRGTALGSRAEAGYDSVSIGVYTGMGRPAKTDPNDFSNGLNTFVGSGAGTSGSGARNSYVGNQAGALTQGDANAGLGYGAGGGTSGNRNVAAGQYAGQFVTGDQNTHQGASAGVQSKGDNNIAIGTGASANLALASQSQNSPISQAMVQAASTAAQGELEGYLATRGVTVNGLNNGTYTIAANGDIVQASTGNVVFTAAEAQNAALKAFQRNGVGGIEASRTTAIGNLSRAVGDDSVALGSSSVAGDKAAVAVGNASKAYGASSVSIGDAAFAREAASIAVGQGAQALGVSSISIGTGNVVSGARSGAIGDPSFIDADDSYAIGNNNTIAAGAKQSFVLGNNVAVTNANNVVLGNNSADRAAVQVTSATVPTVIATLNPDGTVSYSAGPAITYGNFAGTATGVVSVGAAGAERQIVNVAPGAVTATSTDAINGSQLYNAVNALSGSITTIVNNAQTHYYSVNDGGTKQGNYANDGASGANSVAAGAGASASGAGAVAVGNAATASAANSVAVGSNATAGTANSVALGNGSTTTAATPTASTTIQGQTYNFAGANPVGVVSVGAPGAERQIQNVAAGQLSATSTDAVNGSQLYATNQAVNNIQTGGGIKYFHANSQAADSQAAGAESVAIGPQAIALGNNSFAGGNGAQANGAGSIALGAYAISTSSNGVAIGNGASADRAGMNGQKELFSNAS